MKLTAEHTPEQKQRGRRIQSLKEALELTRRERRKRGIYYSRKQLEAAIEHEERQP